LSITSTLSGLRYAVQVGSCDGFGTREEKIRPANTTVNSRNSRKQSLVMEPSTTVHETIPLTVRSPSTDKRQPRTKTPFWEVRVPFQDLPYLRAIVRSSFDVSSRNLSSSGSYWAMRAMKSALRVSLHSLVIFLSFLRETPVRSRA